MGSDLQGFGRSDCNQAAGAFYNLLCCDWFECALQHIDGYKDEFLVKSLARYRQRDKMIMKIKAGDFEEGQSNSNEEDGEAFN